MEVGSTKINGYDVEELDGKPVDVRTRTGLFTGTLAVTYTPKDEKWYPTSITVDMPDGKRLFQASEVLSVKPKRNKWTR